MGQPLLDLTPIGKNNTNVTTYHLDSTHVGTKTSDPKPLTRPTESSKLKGKSHVPEDPESHPSLLDSSSSESDSSDDSKYRIYKRRGRNKNKNQQKRTKQDSLESLSRGI